LRTSLFRNAQSKGLEKVKTNKEQRTKNKVKQRTRTKNKNNKQRTTLKRVRGQFTLGGSTGAPPSAQQESKDFLR